MSCPSPPPEANRSTLVTAAAPSAHPGRSAALVNAPPRLFADRQISWLTIALVLFGAALWYIRDHRVLARHRRIAGVAGLVLLAVPWLAPASISEVNGSKIWLRLSIFSIQHGEFGKVLVTVSCSALLISKRGLFTTGGWRLLGMKLPHPRSLTPLRLGQVAPLRNAKTTQVAR